MTDRVPGFALDGGGSLTIYLQHESPGPEKEANWLPTPAGAFRPTLRMYQPQEAAFDDTWSPPPVHKVPLTS